MPEWQWCSGLNCLDCNIAAYLAHNRQIEQLAHEKALVYCKVGHNNLEKIICLA
jgi:hypothetical protein